ncbi:MAG: hypothetical protein C4547_09725 [Phycisphaerales bacterium]|nr:MAG: hypothetical protein C4547_09725 [Phycisphaerales bacterium]
MSDAVPPMSAELPQAAPQPGWPGTIGILAIVLGAIGITCIGVCGLGGQVFMLVFPDSGAAAGQADLPVQARVYALASSVVRVVASALLLAGGLALRQRQRKGRGLCLVYAWLRIALIAAGLVAAWTTDIDEMPQSVRDDPNARALVEVMESLEPILPWVLTPLALAWPVFLLIWFHRGAVKAEVAKWATDESFEAWLNRE